MQEHTGLILRLIVIANHRNRMLAHRIPDSIDAGDEDEAGDPLPLDGLIDHCSCLSLAFWNRIGTFCSFAQEVAMLFFEFPEDARWNDDRDCVEFSVILRPYEGTARIGRRFF